jgi:carbon monoxide dehydrogenase subunit G
MTAQVSRLTAAADKRRDHHVAVCDCDEEFRKRSGSCYDSWIMIEVNERIEVAAPPQVVWGILSDPRTVVECVDGAALGERQEDGSYDASLVVKFGPARVSFKARVAVEYDPVSMAGSVVARGKDSIGGTRVQSTMKFSVAGQDNPPASIVPITAEVEISGKLASLIETGANLVTRRMVEDFTEKLAARCAAGVAASK